MLDGEADMSESERVIKAFCEQFSPELRRVRTQRINGVAYPDAWQTALWDKGSQTGFLALAYEGQFHVHIETHGATTDSAADAGRIIAEAMGLSRVQGS